MQLHNCNYNFDLSKQASGRGFPLIEVMAFSGQLCREELPSLQGESTKLQTWN